MPFSYRRRCRLTTLVPPGRTRLRRQGAPRTKKNCSSAESIILVRCSHQSLYSSSRAVTRIHRIRQLGNSWLGILLVAAVPTIRLFGCPCLWKLFCYGVRIFPPARPLHSLRDAERALRGLLPQLMAPSQPIVIHHYCRCRGQVPKHPGVYNFCHIFVRETHPNSASRLVT